MPVCVPSAPQCLSHPASGVLGQLRHHVRVGAERQAYLRVAENLHDHSRRDPLLQLITCVNRATSPQRELFQARIVLSWAEHGVRATARLLGCAVSTVTTWCGRHRRRGLADLHDLPRMCAPRIHGDDVRRRVTAVATSDSPRPWTRWTPGRVAEQVNAEVNTVAAAAAEVPSGHRAAEEQGRASPVSLDPPSILVVSART